MLLLCPTLQEDICCLKDGHFHHKEWGYISFFFVVGKKCSIIFLVYEKINHSTMNAGLKSKVSSRRWTPESPLDCQEIKTINPKGNQP